MMQPAQHRFDVHDKVLAEAVAELLSRARLSRNES